MNSILFLEISIESRFTCESQQSETQDVLHGDTGEKGSSDTYDGSHL